MCVCVEGVGVVSGFVWSGDLHESFAFVDAKLLCHECVDDCVDVLTC
jgi:hypothetical protein